MNYKKITTILIAVTILGLGIWDVIAYVNTEGGGATISELIWEWSRDFPIVPFAFGMLMGHLFTMPKKV